MGLTTKEIRDLTNAQVIPRCFDKHKVKWTAMVRDCDGLLRKHGYSAPRPDDVYQILYPLMVVNEDYAQYLSDKNRSGDRWYKMFTNYMLDALWQQIIDGRK
jgi:hypothetical protein